MSDVVENETVLILDGRRYARIRLGSHISLGADEYKYVDGHRNGYC